MKVSVRLGEESRTCSLISFKSLTIFVVMKLKVSSEKHFYGCGQSLTYTVVFQDGSSVAVQGTNPSFSHKKTFGFLSPKKLYQDS